MFKQLAEGWRWAKLKKAMDVATTAIEAGQIHIADLRLEEAYKLLLETKLPRTTHIEMITLWQFIGLRVTELGYPELAAHCHRMAEILQARFDAGEYYADPGPTAREQTEMRRKAEASVREFFEKNPPPRH